MATIQDVFSHIYTTEAHLGDVAVKNGQIILCTDSEKLYIDHGTTRVSTSDVVYVENEAALPLAPLDKFYITQDTGDIFCYLNGEWKKLNNSDISVGDGLAGDGSTDSPITLDLTGYTTADAVNIKSIASVALVGGSAAEFGIGNSGVKAGDTGLTLESNVGIQIGKTSNTNIALQGSVLTWNGAGLNTANGLVMLNTSGKIDSGLLPEQAAVNIDNYTSNNTIKLTSTAGAVNLISNTGEVGLYSGSTSHIKANVDTIELTATTLSFNGNDQNVAGGIAVINKSTGKLPESILPDTGLSSVAVGSGLSGDGTTDSPLSLDLTSYTSTGGININSASNTIRLGGAGVTIAASTVNIGDNGGITYVNGALILDSSAASPISIGSSSVNTAHGLVQLDENGKVPTNLLPEMSQSWTKTTLNQSDFTTADDTYGGSYKELDGVCSVEVYDSNGYKVEFDVKCDFTNNKTRVYIPSGLTAATISNWTLLYLAKTIA